MSCSRRSISEDHTKHLSNKVPLSTNSTMSKEICSCWSKKNFICPEMYFFYRKFRPLTENFFLYQEISSRGRISLPVAGNFFLWQNITSCGTKLLSVTGYILIWLIMFYRDRKFLPVPGNISLWREIYSYDRKFLLVSGNVFLWRQFESWRRKFNRVTRIVCVYCIYPLLEESSNLYGKYPTLPHPPVSWGCFA